MAAAEEMDDEEYTPTIADREAVDAPEPNDAQPQHAPSRVSRGDDPSGEGPREEPEPSAGVLQRIHAHDRQQAKRTVSRLHRILGHPTNAELIRLLEMKRASDVLLDCAREHECTVCAQHQRRPQVPVSSVPNAQEFNSRVQAYTLWIRIPNIRRALPVLMISDAATRFLEEECSYVSRPKSSFWPWKEPGSGTLAR